MSALFSTPKIPQPVIPPPAPTISSEQVVADATAERARLAAASGRASTILTGPGADNSPAPSGKTLLGSA